MTTAENEMRAAQLRPPGGVISGPHNEVPYEARSMAFVANLAYDESAEVVVRNCFTLFTECGIARDQHEQPHARDGVLRKEDLVIEISL